MKTAVIYARYSSEQQTEQSIAGLLRECMDYAEHHDMMVVDTYIDRAMTGTNDNRNDFQRTLKDGVHIIRSLQIIGHIVFQIIHARPARLERIPCQRSPSARRSRGIPYPLSGG